MSGIVKRKQPTLCGGFVFDAYADVSERFG